MFKKILISSAFGVLLCAGTVVGAEVIVKVRPVAPAAVVETPGPRPGPGFIWVPGYHRWNGTAYMWAPGRWERPPRRRAKWVAARWEHRHGGWVFVEGRWR